MSGDEKPKEDSKLESMFTKFIWLLLTFYCAALFIGFINYNWKIYITGLVPVYVVRSTNDGIFALNTTIYKPIVEAQTVIYWYNNHSDFNSMKDCVVVDNSNWRCTYSDKSGKVIMTKGELQEKDSKLEQVGLLRYCYYQEGKEIAIIPIRLLFELWAL